MLNFLWHFFGWGVISGVSWWLTVGGVCVKVAFSVAILYSNNLDNSPIYEESVTFKMAHFAFVNKSQNQYDYNTSGIWPLLTNAKCVILNVTDSYYAVPQKSPPIQSKKKLPITISPIDQILYIIIRVTRWSNSQMPQV